MQVKVKDRVYFYERGQDTIRKGVVEGFWWWDDVVCPMPITSDNCPHMVNGGLNDPDHKPVRVEVRYAELPWASNPE